MPSYAEVNLAGATVLTNVAKTILVGAILTISPFASAASPADYRPPAGFNGHDWGTPFTTLQAMTLWRAGTVLGFAGKATHFQCIPDLTNGESCSTTYSMLDQRTEGEGSHALGEYYFRYDNNPWKEQGIDVKTISYLFCASTVGNYLPHPLKESLKLCGARVLFHSEAAQASATQGEDYVSNYDRILAKLVADYGDPPGYQRRAGISVTTVDETITSPETPRLSPGRYRWCGLDDGDRPLVPPCSATVTLSFDPATGYGTVLFATAPVYVFAYARHMTGDENNELYVLLEGPTPEHKFPKLQVQCTGNHICQPSKASMSARQLHDFQP